MQPLLDEAVVFLITGPSGAGKSTVAHRLAARFIRGVHVEGDFFRRSVVSGRQDMTPDPSPDALAQVHLRYQLAATVTDAYFAEGFAVVVEDVVAGPQLAHWNALIRSRPFHVFVLMPSIETVSARDASRVLSGYHEWSVSQLYGAFLNDTPRIGTWLDTSGQSPDETVDEILSLRNSN